MSYQLAYGQQARKALKRLRRSGSFPEKVLVELLTHLIVGTKLPNKFKDHALQGELAEFRECHLAFDLLVEYKRNEKLGIVTIARVGTHSELFGK